MDSSFHTIRYIIFKNMYSVAPKTDILLIWYALNNDFNTNCKLAFNISIKTFSIRFFMHGPLQTGLKYENVKWSSGRVCILQFKFEWQEGLTAVGDLQQCFCHMFLFLFFSLKSTKQLSTLPFNVLVRAGDKQ